MTSQIPTSGRCIQCGEHMESEFQICKVEDDSHCVSSVTQFAMPDGHRIHADDFDLHDIMMDLALEIQNPEALEKLGEIIQIPNAMHLLIDGYQDDEQSTSTTTHVWIRPSALFHQVVEAVKLADLEALEKMKQQIASAGASTDQIQ